eukprot:COSAG02_NODE_17437_length_1003_cov_3.495575_2_plen_94_part_01
MSGQASFIILCACVRVCVPPMEVRSSQPIVAIVIIWLSRIVSTSNDFSESLSTQAGAQTCIEILCVRGGGGGGRKEVALFGVGGGGVSPTSSLV